MNSHSSSMDWYSTFMYKERNTQPTMLCDGLNGIPPLPSIQNLISFYDQEYLQHMDYATILSNHPESSTLLSHNPRPLQIRNNPTDINGTDFITRCEENVVQQLYPQFFTNTLCNDDPNDQLKQCLASNPISNFYSLESNPHSSISSESPFIFMQHTNIERDRMVNSFKNLCEDNKMLESTIDVSTVSPKARPERTKFSENQLGRLDEIFKENPYPCKLLIQHIAGEFCVPYSSIKNFFKNRRSKESKSGKAPKKSNIEKLQLQLPKLEAFFQENHYHSKSAQKLKAMELNLPQEFVFMFFRKRRTELQEKSRLRTYFNTEQRKHLDKIFKDNPKPTRAHCEQIAVELGFQCEAIFNFFKNKRARTK